MTFPVAATPEIGAALAGLDMLATLPVVDHLAVFADVHQQLQDALATLDEV